MISFLTGAVVSVSGSRLDVRMGPIGVSVLVPAALAETLRVGDGVELWTSLVVREDALTLYGFAEPEDRTLWELLISVSGVGPKTALGLLSAPRGTVISAIQLGDIAALARAPGLGKKTAEKICLELRDKLDELALVSSASPAKPRESAAAHEALAALENLGLSRIDASRRIEGAPEGASAEDLVKWALGR